MRLSLGKGAELAAIVADVGIVDVAVDDVADNIAARCPARALRERDVELARRQRNLR
jgi:hypothetical protein